MERRWKARNAVLVVFLAAVLISYVGRYSTLQFGPLREGIAKKESRELFEFVIRSTYPYDVLVFSRPRALALMTGRRVSGGYSPADPCRLWQYRREIGASYVITGPAPDPFNQDAAYLRQFVARFDEDLRPVMAKGGPRRVSNSAGSLSAGESTSVAALRRPYVRKLEATEPE